VRGQQIRRTVATRVELARAAGPRHALGSLRRDLAHRRLVDERRRSVAHAVWEDAARELGASVVELSPVLREIRLGDVTTRITGQTVLLNDEVSSELAEDKPLVYRLLRTAGLPVPEHVSLAARERADAEAFLARGPVPCVVKPARGSGGDGVTGEVRRPEQLRCALRVALRDADELLVERQVRGDVYRLLLLDGELLDVIRRFPPRLVGDGRSTVAELMLAEYDRRIAGEDDDAALKPFRVDLDCLFTLERQGLSLRSVPEAGAVVTVKTVTNQNRREDNETVRTPVPDELRAEAASAAATVGLRLAGVDVIAPALRAPLEASGGVILDVNAVPALHHHYRVADRAAATRVAVPILRALLSADRPVAASKPG
jgi:D-alanine-D-alanine ligase-like ATP-grasp enzyme